ncbi:hypothetical protein AGMMS50293_16020 [Spirochaetia bacterium]|nr:hypothetical protein AGMMS50293_16020 [Spirochaetia bacterium]
MGRFTRFYSLVIVVFLLLACGKQEETTAQKPNAPVSNARYTPDGRRIITMGTWYDRYYMSKHQTIEDDPGMSYPETAELRLAKIREIEARYNVVFNSVNLTFDGVQESIETSVPEGKPDVDLYEVDLKFGIPAALKNYALSLEEIGLEGTDVLSTQNVMKYLKLSGHSEAYLFTPAVSGGTSAYVLAYNKDLIRKAGLPSPQDLWERGEWTWDRWRQYLKVLTRDADNDGRPEVYGFSGYWTNLLTNLLLSNNAGIARGAQEELSSPGALEALRFIYDMYNTDKTARPWDVSNWEINNRLYAEGLSGFWIGADWIFNEQGGKNLPFEIGVVPWPVGPGGSKETNRHSQPQNNWYLIPRGVEDPLLVYQVIFDWLNWYNDDRSLVDDRWSRSQYMNDRNFDYAAMMASRPGFDMWDNLGLNFDLVPMITGQVGPEDLVQEYSSRIQAVLNDFFD